MGRTAMRPYTSGYSTCSPVCKSQRVMMPPKSVVCTVVASTFPHTATPLGATAQALAQLTTGHLPNL